MQQRSPIPRRASRTEEDAFEVGPESMYTQRLPTSTRRYRQDTDEDVQVVRQGNRQPVIHYDEPPPKYHNRRRRFHWLFFVGLAMFTMLVGWLLLTSIQTWWMNKQNDLAYGMPRTFQVSAVVFKNDTSEEPTHVIALNLNDRVEIIVLPQGRAANAKISTGPQILDPDPSLVPVTVSFADDGSSYKAMIVHIETQTIIYSNDGQDFTYLTAHDVSSAFSERVQQVELQTQALFTAPIVLAPTCTTNSTVTPAIGSITNRAVVTLTSICRAISSVAQLAKQRSRTFV